MPSAGSTDLNSMTTLFDRALDQLSQDKTPPHDGLLYSGNRHESVPRALFLDKRLTPLERNAWQVFRLMLNQDGLTAFPTYDQLSPYLASMPCTPKASHETVARALTVLRLARWLSLVVRRQRDPRSGRIRGNLYVLHDEPLTPFETLQLDPDYLELVGQSLEHASKAIQRVSTQALKELTEDPLLQGHTLPTRLQILTQRMAHNKPATGESYPQSSDMHESEESRHKSEENMAALLRKREWLPSDFKVSAEASQSNSLRNRKPDRTSSTVNSNNYSIRTIPRAQECMNLRLPERFKALKDEQRAGALAALLQVDTSLQQAVLDEWAVRCSDGNIRNPAGYLFGIIQKAIRGEFNPITSFG